MKIHIQQEPEVTLEQFCDANGLDIELKPYRPAFDKTALWSCEFVPWCELSDGLGRLLPCRVLGGSQEQAIKELARRVSGRTLVIDYNLPSCREIRVPDSLVPGDVDSLLVIAAAAPSEPPRSPNSSATSPQLEEQRLLLELTSDDWRWLRYSGADVRISARDLITGRAIGFEVYSWATEEILSEQGFLLPNVPYRHLTPLAAVKSAMKKQREKQGGGDMLNTEAIEPRPGYYWRRCRVCKHKGWVYKGLGRSTKRPKVPCPTCSGQGIEWIKKPVFRNGPVPEELSSYKRSPGFALNWLAARKASVLARWDNGRWAGYVVRSSDGSLLSGFTRDIHGQFFGHPTPLAAIRSAMVFAQRNEEESPC